MGNNTFGALVRYQKYYVIKQKNGNMGHAIEFFVGLMPVLLGEGIKILRCYLVIAYIICCR